MSPKSVHELVLDPFWTHFELKNERLNYGQIAIWRYKSMGPES